MNDAKIREAFDKYKAKTIYPDSVCEEDFRAGYLALLNELEPVPDCSPMFYLPEGVNHDQ